jgi:hypothetical protein
MAHIRIQQLLSLLEEGFQRAAWHGPNLRSALRGVTWQQAQWRPAVGVHNIWELAVHAAYWKYVVRRRLLGETGRGFPETGRNWFARPSSNQSDRVTPQKTWRRDIALLVGLHRELRVTVAPLDNKALDKPALGSRQTPAQMIAGIALHDVYHAGQIQLLKRLYAKRRGA